jgi:hypothetical protein
MRLLTKSLQAISVLGIFISVNLWCWSTYTCSKPICLGFIGLQILSNILTKKTT